MRDDFQKYSDKQLENGDFRKEWEALEESRYDDETGLPLDESYLERGLPEYLQISLKNMKESWSIEDSGGTDLHWDIYWCDLNADINSAEVDGVISSEQAAYLRRVYLRMRKDD